MNISLLEAKDCVISASNSCFLCDLGGCRSTEPPFRESGKLPRDCTQGYPLLCGPEPGQGVGRGCGERVRECARFFNLFFYIIWEIASNGSPYGLITICITLFQQSLAPEQGEWQDHRTHHRTRSSGLDFWLAFVSSLRRELEKRAKSESGHLLVPVSVSVGRGQRRLGRPSLFSEYNLFF